MGFSPECEVVGLKPSSLCHRIIRHINGTVNDKQTAFAESVNAGVSHAKIFLHNLKKVEYSRFTNSVKSNVIFRVRHSELVSESLNYIRDAEINSP